MKSFIHHPNGINILIVYQLKTSAAVQGADSSFVCHTGVHVNDNTSLIDYNVHHIHKCVHQNEDFLLADLPLTLVKREVFLNNGK